MTFWTVVFIVVGVLVLTTQFFRLIDLIERPARRDVPHGTRHAA